MTRAHVYARLLKFVLGIDRSSWHVVEKRDPHTNNLRFVECGRILKIEGIVYATHVPNSYFLCVLGTLQNPTFYENYAHTSHIFRKLCKCSHT